MIQRMCEDLDRMLMLRKYPVRVEYGPQFSKQDRSNSRIQIQRDTQAGDVFQPIRGTQRNTRKRAVRHLGCIAWVWAQSTKPGPLHSDHEELCDAYVDALHTSLQDWVKEARAGEDIQVQSGRLLDEDEVKAFDYGEWPGVVYEMKFRIPRGVDLRDGEGLGLPEAGGNITGVSGRTEVYRVPAPEGATPETGCGA